MAKKNVTYHDYRDMEHGLVALPCKGCKLPECHWCNPENYDCDCDACIYRRRMQ